MENLELDCNLSGMNDHQPKRWCDFIFHVIPILRHSGVFWDSALALLHGGAVQFVMANPLRWRSSMESAHVSLAILPQRVPIASQPTFSRGSSVLVSWCEQLPLLPEAGRAFPSTSWIGLSTAVGILFWPRCDPVTVSQSKFAGAYLSYGVSTATSLNWSTNQGRSVLEPILDPASAETHVNKVNDSACQIYCLMLLPEAGSLVAGSLASALVRWSSAMVR
jgi:hypothetical protein